MKRDKIKKKISKRIQYKQRPIKRKKSIIARQNKQKDNPDF
jgi:hypothetical protein